MSVKVPDEQENYKGPVAIFHILSNVGNPYTCYSHQVNNNNVQLPVMPRHVKYSQCIQSDHSHMLLGINASERTFHIVFHNGVSFADNIGHILQSKP